MTAFRIRRAYRCQHDRNWNSLDSSWKPPENRYSVLWRAFKESRNKGTMHSNSNQLRPSSEFSWTREIQKKKTRLVVPRKQKQFSFWKAEQVRLSKKAFYQSIISRLLTHIRLFKTVCAVEIITSILHADSQNYHYKRLKLNSCNDLIFTL